MPGNFIEGIEGGERNLLNDVLMNKLRTVQIKVQ
jgi:hypothetical protein